MFRTELPIAPATGQLPRTAQVLTMGSCFADSIGARLATNKVATLANPFGTVFQPLALLRLLRAAAGEDVDWQQHLVEAHGRWQSYDLHSSIGAASPVELLQTIQELVRRAGEFLRQTDVVLLTLGTAWAYRLRETGELVSNCHKQPADLFERELLTPDDIINALAETHAYVRRLNPGLRFVLTVSPVRHLKDTLPLNSVSKSVLRLATHIASDLLPGVAYFPAYELLVDDLRDYRFYAADMLHPSEVAEDYIWEKFARTYFDAEFGRFRKDWTAIQQALGHRAMHIGAPEHRQFLESTLAKLEQLSLRKVDVAAETASFRAQLAALPEPTLPELLVEEDDNEERIDIGDAENTESISPAGIPINAPAAAQADSRPPRLSPEEFRAQRNNRPARDRRDGRGKQMSPAENAAAQPVDEDRSTATTSLLENGTSSSESVPELPPLNIELPRIDVTVEPATGFEPQEAGKKKKRRSRGGAKRTARKHALQLAAEVESFQGISLATGQAVTEAAEASASTEEGASQQGQKSSVIAKSVPVKRGGRRGVVGQPLYAVPSAELADSATPPVSVPASTVEEGVVATVNSSTNNGIELPLQVPTKAADSRNRRRKGDKQASASSESGREQAGPGAVAAIENAASVPANAVETAEPAAASVSEPAEAGKGGRNRNSKRQAPSVAPVSAPAAAETAKPNAAAVANPDLLETPAAPTPRKSNRARRAATGGRAEKPAVDTPVIPVSAETMPRTQVAAGRMTGSSASLVENITPGKKAPAKPKTAAPKAPKSPKAVAATSAAEPVVVTPKTIKPAKPTKPTAKAAVKPAPPKAPKAKPKAKPKVVKKPTKPE